MFFWLEPKEPKAQGQTNAPLFVRPSTLDSMIKSGFFICSDRLKTRLRDMRGNKRRCFSPGYYSNKYLKLGRKEALIMFLTFGKNERALRGGMLVVED